MRLVEKYHYPLLVLLCLALYLPGITTMPPLDRDEARFIQASKQMLESGDYINISFQDQPRHKKPIGIYWLQSFSASLFGADEIAAYRLVSVLGMLGAILALYYWLRCNSFADLALLASGILAISLGIVIEVHQAKTDSVLLFMVVMVQGALLTCYLAHFQRQVRPERWVVYIFWLSLGLGMLVKGPVVVLVAGLTGLAISIIHRDIRWLLMLRPFTGVPLALLIVAPWLIAIEQQTGGQFLSGGYAEDIIPKLLGGVESHGAPPGYYLLLMPVFFWPGVMLLLAAVPIIYAERRNMLVTFLLAWLVPGWIIFELIPTKLPHYVFPMYPALATLVAYGAIQLVVSPKRQLMKAGLAVWTVIALGFVAAIVALPLLLKLEIAMVDILIAVLGLGMIGAVLHYKPPKRFMVMALYSVVMCGYIFQSFLPRLEPVWISRQLYEVVRVEKNEQGKIAISGYHEPSAVFLLGTDTLLTDVSGVASHLASGGSSSIGVVTDKEVDTLSELLASHAQTLHEVGEVEGFNYSKGKKVTLKIFTWEPEQ